MEKDSFYLQIFTIWVISGAHIIVSNFNDAIIVAMADGKKVGD